MNNTAARPKRNTRTHSSAAAFAGIIGLPEPGRGPTYGDGGLFAFGQQFNRAFDDLAADRRPELRSFAHNERRLAAVLR